MVKMTKLVTTLHVDEDMEKLDLLHTASGNVKRYSLSAKVWQCLTKTKHEGA